MARCGGRIRTSASGSMTDWAYRDRATQRVGACEAASLGGVPSSVTTTRMRGDITGGLCGMWSCNDTCPYRKSNSDIMLVQASEERFCSGAPNGRDRARSRRSDAPPKNLQNAYESAYYISKSRRRFGVSTWARRSRFFRTSTGSHHSFKPRSSAITRAAI